MQTESPGPNTAGRAPNFILSRLPQQQYTELSRHFVPVDLPQGMHMGEPNQANKFIYFPVSGLVSVDALTEAGESVEVGVIGREGFAGVAGLLGQPQMPHSVIIQGAGSGLRIRTSVLREEFLKGGVLAELVHQFIYLQIVQTSQSALCNRLHPVDARIARWLLTASDRMKSEKLGLTQEFLAQMLGSRRSTVTVAAGNLQRKGLIDYARGRVQILDRPGLEGVACECYGIVRSAYQRVLGEH